MICRIEKNKSGDVRIGCDPKPGIYFSGIVLESWALTSLLSFKADLEPCHLFAFMPAA